MTQRFTFLTFSNKGDIARHVWPYLCPVYRSLDSKLKTGIFDEATLV